METKIYFRVRPEHKGYTHEDFEDLEEAVTRCNERNAIRPKSLECEKGTFYKGNNCKLQKVTVTIEEITF